MPAAEPEPGSFEEAAADGVDVAGAVDVTGVEGVGVVGSAPGDGEVVRRPGTGSSCPQLGFMQ